MGDSVVPLTPRGCVEPSVRLKQPAETEGKFFLLVCVVLFVTRSDGTLCHQELALLTATHGTGQLASKHVDVEAANMV